jgi:mono/diheme cytochrome c family protein
MTRIRIAALVASLVAATALSACREVAEVDPDWADRPLPSPDGALDVRMADAGASLFRRNCSACHYIGGPDPDAGLGPNLQGVTFRRNTAWIRSMIANPDSMLDADTITGRLYEEYGIAMLNVGATPAEVRALVEFLWRADRGGR